MIFGYQIAILCIFISVLASLSCSASVSIAENNGKVKLANEYVEIGYDLDKGVYDAIDKKAKLIAIQNAAFQVEDWASTDTGLKHSWTARSVRDDFGAGKAIIIKSSGKSRPAILLDIILYDKESFITMAAGIENTTEAPLTIKKMQPMTGATGFSSITDKQDPVTLNGASGGTETFVTHSFDRRNENALLASFTSGNGKKSIVWGGLTYKDFIKFASVGITASLDETRKVELEKSAPEGCALPSYIRSWNGKGLDTGNGKMVRKASGGPYQFPRAIEIAQPHYSATWISNDMIQVTLSGLQKTRAYKIGISWWDFDGKGRKQSIAMLVGNEHKTIIPARGLPDYVNKGQLPEEIVFSVPKAAYESSHAHLFIKKEAGYPDAIVGEVWLYECEKDLPESGPIFRTAKISPVASLKQLINLDIRSEDPHGRLVEPGTTFGLLDKFYVDYATSNPFEALEKYGLAVRTAMKTKPHIYSFPTVCAWYASGSHPGCPYINHTKGMVEEAEFAAKSGFTKYAPAGVRVVPDAGENNNEQGWWDDQHWAEYGHYVEPYETTEKYCKAVAAQGCIPFTYVQTGIISVDFMQAHPEWAVFNDISNVVLPSGHRNNSSNFDYTDPGFQAHVRKVWANLRKGGMKGVMFDYPGSGWREGGFENKYATTASAYRTIFDLCKKSLGPDSYVHERLIGQYGQPQTDVTAGLVDSQRTEWDTHAATPEMYTKVGLRWFKNRVIYTYDMDAKNFLYVQPNNRDGVRQVLTMAYTVAPRLLLGTSFRSMTPEQVYDLSRIYPIHTAAKSARPLDAFSGQPFPRIYDYSIDSKWHQVVFYNPDTVKESVVDVALSGDTAMGAMGLDPAKSYHVYDFWNDRYIGKLNGSQKLAQTLRPGETRMMSVREVANHPQYISTNRHIMQGYLDVSKAVWNAESQSLSGTSDVIGDETYKIIIACNGRIPKSCSASGSECSIKMIDKAAGIAVLSIDDTTGGAVGWSVEWK